MDLHYYTEAQTASGSQRVGGQDTSPEVVTARVQSTRSLWDSAYIENSWITRDVLPEGDKAIRLIPRMQAKIEAKYPGTKLAITEYNFGGGAHISGAIAQADALGIFGQSGVFAATRWQMSENEQFLEAAFKMYRGFDGKNANFGNVSLGTSSSDVSKVTVYASLDSAAAAPGRAVFGPSTAVTGSRMCPCTIYHYRASSEFTVSPRIPLIRRSWARSHRRGRLSSWPCPQ